jgi:GAF domain-containing protein
VRSPVDLHPVLQSIVDRVRQSGIWPMCAIGLIDPEDQEILVPAQSGFQENYPRDIKFPASGSATLEAIRRNQPIAIQDVREDTEFPVLQEAARAAGYRSILLIPLAVEEIHGVVTFGSPQAHEYSSSEIQLANAIAQQVMIAIDNAYHYEREKQRVEHLQRLNQIIADQNRLLQRSAQTHAALTNLVLADAGLEGILKAIRELLGNPVFIENENLQLLGYSEDWEYFDRHRLASIQAGGTAPELFTHPGIASFLDELRHTRRPVLIPPRPEIGLERRRIVAPITVGGEVLGYVWVMEALRPFDQQDLMTAEQAALVIALEMVKQRARYETELRLKADFLGDLLLQNPADETELLQRARYLGYSFTRPSVLMIVDCVRASLPQGRREARQDQRLAPTRGEHAVDPPAIVPGLATGAENFSLIQRVQRTLNQYTDENLVAIQSSQILIIAPAPTPAATHPPPSPQQGRRRNSSDELPHFTRPAQLADAIREDLKRFDPDLKVLLGISEPCQNLADIQSAYHQARRTIEAARNLGRLDETLHLSDLGIYGILYREGDAGELHAFAEKMLHPILMYDQQHGTELLKTLDIYLTHQGRLGESAQQLFIHVNTLRQRLERINEILGAPGSTRPGRRPRSLDDPHLRLNLELALRVREVLPRPE